MIRQFMKPYNARPAYAEMSKEIQQVLKAGNYTAANGATCALPSHAIRQAVVFPHDEKVKRNEAIFEARYKEKKGNIAIVPMTSFGAAIRLANGIRLDNNMQSPVKENNKTVVLNFASAYSAGGGFLKGATAQEEQLCYHSTLYASLNSKAARGYYNYQRERKLSKNTDAVIHSPSVFIIRDEDTKQLLQDATKVGVLSCAAVDWRRYPPDVLDGAARDECIKQGRDAMRERIRRILTIAVNEHYDNIVLGAWGCGVFRNDPRVVAEWFKEAIVAGGFEHYFKNIVFAVPKGRDDNYAAFAQTFM